MRGLEHSHLLSIINYDRESGIFSWKYREDVPPHTNARFAGKPMKNPAKDRYKKIVINGRKYLAHRLAWFYVHAEWPEEIDHIDGNKLNNKLENLRPATHLQNVRNCQTPKTNTSGYKGVSWHKGRKKWVASIKVDGKRKDLGRFGCPKTAHAAYCEAANKYYGEFARTA